MISTRRPFSGLSRSISCGVKSLLVLAFAIAVLPIRYPGTRDTPPRWGSQMGESVTILSGKTKRCGRYRLQEATGSGRMRATSGVVVARSGRDRCLRQARTGGDSPDFASEPAVAPNGLGAIVMVCRVRDPKEAQP